MSEKVYQFLRKLRIVPTFKGRDGTGFYYEWNFWRKLVLIVEFEDVLRDSFVVVVCAGYGFSFYIYPTRWLEKQRKAGR